VLTLLFELKDKVKHFLSKLKYDLVTYFDDEDWFCQLTSSADIFSNLMVSIFNFKALIRTFLKCVGR
jgi:hypothetical protein